MNREYIALVRRTMITSFGEESDYIEIRGYSSKLANDSAQVFMLQNASDTIRMEVVAVFPDHTS